MKRIAASPNEATIFFREQTTSKAFQGMNGTWVECDGNATGDMINASLSGSCDEQRRLSAPPTYKIFHSIWECHIP